MDLESLYQSLVGKTFQGNYLGQWSRGDSNSQTYHVIEVTGPPELENILSNIHKLGDGRVWKGFIIQGNPNYKLYALLENWPGIVTSNTFKIVTVNRFSFPEEEWKERQKYSECAGYNISLQLVYDPTINMTGT